ncbi:unnamed protein product [Porites lobata]|uniref:Uncharacterized protein n=1 Tax=Porites lobata TaxID=104759 RepID=A0ABN8PBN7_9CNID|nr:unnamed protein product [Porites lobata]
MCSGSFLNTGKLSRQQHEVFGLVITSLYQIKIRAVRMTQNSFKTLQEALLLSLEEKLIDDEEFAVLYEEFTPQNLPFRHWDYEKSKRKQRPRRVFEKSDISLLVDVLQMPDTFSCPNGTVCDSTEGLCVIL